MSSEMSALAELLASHYEEIEAKDKRIAELEARISKAMNFIILVDDDDYDVIQALKGQANE